jgi:phosphoribosylformylglycinamidine cyclo-ligase
LDYIATGRNKPERTEQIVAGVADGCVQAGCALVGGETAEHPGLMPDDEYDIAGFAVGFVDHGDIIDGAAAKPGDVIIGLTSSGLHSNGYSLVRKILAGELADLGRHVPELGRTLGEELMEPTRIYVSPVMDAIGRFGKGIKGIAHITGGGFFENIPRMLPQGVRAVIDTTKIPTPPVFGILAKKGGIPKHDMYNTFNMGIGLALCVGESCADSVASAMRASGETPLIIGRCVSGGEGVELTW